MFCLKTALLNIRRHKSKSILVVLTCMLIVIFVFIYMNGIRTNEEQLHSLPQAIPVYAQICNLNGSQEVGLLIREQLLDDVQSTGKIKDLHYTARLAGSLSPATDTGNLSGICSVQGFNDIGTVPNLPDRKIQLADGRDTAFFQGTEALCLASESFLQQNKLSIGDTVDLELFMYKYFSPESSVYTLEPLAKGSLRIAGSISAPTSGKDPVNTDILCPVGWMKEKYVQTGEIFYLDSASFTVADALNLNAFKEAMTQCHLIPVSTLSKYFIWGEALRVKDEVFVSTAGRLKSNLSVLYTFAAVIFAVIALVGYAIAYLLMQGRRTDIAIMRSLGTSRRMCVVMMLMEFALLGLAGSLFGIICAFIWLGPAWSTLLYALFFTASLLTGIAAAALQLSRGNTMTGLIKTES